MGKAWYIGTGDQPWWLVVAPVADITDPVHRFSSPGGIIWFVVYRRSFMQIAHCVRRLIAGGCLVIAALALFQSGYAQSTVDCATTVVVQPGDTLSLIAGRQLGSQVTYQAIVAATNVKAAVDSSYTAITNPNTLVVGWKLCIPAASGAASSPVNSVVSNVQSLPVATPSTTAAPTPTATPLIWLKPPTLDLPLNEMHPLMVEYMRRQSYPGSDIVFEQTLAPGANYNRYIVSYRAEGYKIYALLTVPQGAKPATGWPVIIFNHGFIPPEIYRTTERYVAYVDGFARNGYIVFRSDYRGHGFSEGEPTSSRGSPAYTIDVLNAVASMKRFADADPARIGMWGHSMGGLLTLRSMVTTKDVKVGVIWAGVVASYPDLYNQRNPQPNSQPVDAATAQRRRWREEIVEQWGTPEEAPDIWAAISPNAYLSEISGPLQLHHGTVDSDVPVRYSQTLDLQMQAVGQTVEYYEYPGDNHNLSVNFNTAMARSIAFFDRYLK
jgi:dienelactone hydrolase/LysM repeat protein